LAQLDHSRSNPATVNLNLGFTGTTRAHSGALTADLATRLPGHRVTPTTKARKQVIELGKFDLGFTFAGLGVLGENVEDDCGPVDYLHFYGVFECAALARGKLCVGNDGVDANGHNDLVKFLDLSATKIGGGVWVRLALKHTVENHRTGCFAECSQFFHRILSVFLIALGIDADKNDVLDTQLAVLDLGNILEFGAKAVYASERDAVG
jgi:hypothetical protein